MKSNYTQIYALLEKVTPLQADCGKLCNKACCEGGEDTGMHLFPGEEVMFENESNWMVMKDTDLSYGENKNIKLAVCKGECIRGKRPLGCRIFPLTPYISEEENLIIKMDPRAKVRCPLADHTTINKLQPSFITAVKKAIEMLVQDNEVKAFMKYISREIDRYQETHFYRLANSRYKKKRMIPRR